MPSLSGHPTQKSAGYTLCVLGCGTMGIAILSGLLDSLDLDALSHPSKGASTSKKSHHLEESDAAPISNATPTRFLACVNSENSINRLRAAFDTCSWGRLVSATMKQNVASVQAADVVLLCCKPHMAKDILSELGMRDALEGKLLISVLAGVTVPQLSEWVSPTTRVIRAMANTPSRIREGMTVVTRPSFPGDAQILSNIFSAIGRHRFVDEKYFDVCTALAGSGPAFVCTILEAMTDGAVLMGLPRAEATELAAQTLQGTARMVLQGGEHPAALRNAVTTPGGCTIAGLMVLEDGKLRSTVARAIEAATLKAASLGQPK